jgi:hypothetical protein
MAPLNAREGERAGGLSEPGSVHREGELLRVHSPAFGGGGRSSQAR